MSSKYDPLYNAIADLWGGKGCSRRQTRSGEFWFQGDDFATFLVSPPGTKVELCDDSGEPIPNCVVEADKVVVQCLGDAPDAWWLVGTDGSYARGKLKLEASA